jgi:hypothetical protein
MTWIACSRLSSTATGATRRRNLEREGETMKKFLMLHYGYEEPTPEIMAAWQS